MLSSLLLLNIVVYFSLSSLYEMFGYVVVIDAVGRNGGHTAVTLVHPAGISIHTLLNLDPDGLIKLIPFGNPGNAIDSEVNNPAHSIVPGGQLVLSAPLDPVSPCNPLSPFIVLEPHNSTVLFVPGFPDGGAFCTLVAYDAVTAVISTLNGVSAVVANIE